MLLQHNRFQVYLCNTTKIDKTFLQNNMDESVTNTLRPKKYKFCFKQNAINMNK